MKIPILINWCKELALKILDESPVRTNSNLDHLQVGERIDEIISPVLFGDWNPSWLAKDLMLKIPGSETGIRIWDANISVEENSREVIKFKVEAGEEHQQFEFRLNDSPRFVAVGGTSLSIAGDRRY